MERGRLEASDIAKEVKAKELFEDVLLPELNKFTDEAENLGMTLDALSDIKGNLFK